MDISLNVEHMERLLEVHITEDVWELAVDLHVKVDIFALDVSGSCANLSSG